jgi:2,3-bisphosphoglycerate-independent phosphoglycerate mutase
VKELNMATNYKKAMLIILDGWGVNSTNTGNPTINSNLPFFYNLIKNYPEATLSASSESVGLSNGEFGNSEVGHLNLGAGRIVWQDYARINRLIANKTFFKNKNLVEFYEATLKNDKNLHLIGLVSDGGIHSHINHLLALLDEAKNIGLKKVYVHVFTDGRDTTPKNAEIFIKQLENKFSEIGIGKIATISGRYYAMDRNKRIERTDKAYSVIANGVGATATSPEDAINQAYQKNQTDEFITPTVILENNQPISKIESGDSIMFFNFRPDRMRQITERIYKSNNHLNILTMTDYFNNSKYPIKFIINNEKVFNTLPEVISNNNLTQLHIAETEKYAHVTYFFNGGIEKPFPGEKRILIPSPKVATYDLKPEMSANIITEKVIDNLDKFDFMVINYANADMVGHTGNMNAAKIALETIDKDLEKLIPLALEKNYSIIITADHGNVEQMTDVSGNIETEHSTNPVPFILITPINKLNKPNDLNKFLNSEPIGVLADVAPTILDIMKIEKPVEMTGTSLIRSL